MRLWATAGWDGSRPAFSTRSQRSTCLAYGYGINYEYGPVPSGNGRRRPEGEAGQLAHLRHSLGDRATRRIVPHSYLRPNRTRRRSSGPLQPDVAGLASARRRPARRAHRRPRRPDGESPPALLRPIVARLRHADLQRRGLSQGGGTEDRVGDDLEGPVPVRRRIAGAGTAAPPGVLPGGVRLAGSDGQVPGGPSDLRCLSREGRHSLERYASGSGHRRVDAHARR